MMIYVLVETEIPSILNTCTTRFQTRERASFVLTLSGVCMERVDLLATELGFNQIRGTRNNGAPDDNGGPAGI